MRLANSDWHFVIPLQEGRVPVLVVERPEVFRRYVTELQRQVTGDEGSFVLSENWEPIPMEKHLRLISDVFTLDLNERKQLTALHKQLCAMAYDERHLLSTGECKQSVMQWLSLMEQDMDIPLCFDEEWDISALLKAADFRFDDGEQDILLRLDRYLCICSVFLHCRIVAFVHLRACLSAEECKQLYKTAQYRKIQLLLLEPAQPSEKLKEERYFVIDKDLCELYDEDV